MVLPQNRRFEHLELASLNLRFLLNIIINLSIRTLNSPTLRQAQNRYRLW